MTWSSRDTLACEASAEATVAAKAAARKSIWKTVPPTRSAISGNVSSVRWKFATFGKTDWATWPLTRKMPPPMSRVMMIAFEISEDLRASSAYIVIASKPMNEKQTTVAPVSTAGSPMPEWTNGLLESSVPLPMPCDSCTTASTMNAPIRATENATRAKFTLAVELRLQMLSPVIAATNTTTQIQAGTLGNSELRYSR